MTVPMVMVVSTIAVVTVWMVLCVTNKLGSVTRGVTRGIPTATADNVSVCVVLINVNLFLKKNSRNFNVDNVPKKEYFTNYHVLLYKNLFQINAHVCNVTVQDNSSHSKSSKILYLIQIDTWYKFVLNTNWWRQLKVHITIMHHLFLWTMHKGFF